MLVPFVFNKQKLLTKESYSFRIIINRGVTDSKRFALVKSVFQKSNLTLVGAVAFLMFMFLNGLYNADYRNDDADNRYDNADNTNDCF